MLGEHSSTRLKTLNGLREVIFIQVVTQNHGNGVVTNKVLTNDESLSETLWFLLNFIGKFATKLTATSQKIKKITSFFWGNNDQDLSNTGIDQCVERVEDHGFVVNGEKLLTSNLGYGAKTSASASSEDNSLHIRCRVPHSTKKRLPPRGYQNYEEGLAFSSYED